MSQSGQQCIAQANQLKTQINLSISSLNQTKEDLISISDDAQQATIAPLNLNQVDPYGSGRKGIDFLLPSILALIIFMGASSGLGRAIAGERHDGSLTRVFLTPTSNFTIISGTQLFYMLFETLRSSLIIFIAIALFGVTVSGSILDIIVIIALFAFGATGVGMVLSVLTRSQEQYMAISMLVSMPMMFLSGVFIPIQTMPPIFQGITAVLPITYAADALRGIMIKGFGLTQVIPDIVYLAFFGVFIFLLTILLFKRELV
jgi:ABC-2 type transport system permease protein